MLRMKAFFSSPRFVFGLVWVLTAGLFFWGWSTYFYAAGDRAREVIKSKTQDSSGVLRPITAESLKSAITSDGSKLSIVNIWATWCEPCGRELPAFAAAQEKFGSQGVSVKLLSADEKGEEANVKRFLASKGIHFETYILNEPAPVFMKQIQPTWSGALPATFLFKPDGSLHSFFLGEISGEQLERKIQGAISGS
jgi:thiol-disulfide isomerase/thioredoxin